MFVLTCLIYETAEWISVKFGILFFRNNYHINLNLIYICPIYPLPPHDLKLSLVDFLKGDSLYKNWFMTLNIGLIMI
jgi:hypothetical protein